MRRFSLLSVVTTFVFFGLQVPFVNADAIRCSGNETGLTVSEVQVRSQHGTNTKEHSVDAPPTQLLSQIYLERMLSNTRENFSSDLAFLLHSNPSASAIIYLDFDGQDWQTDSCWIGEYGIAEGETAQGYTLDGDASSFSDIERNAIFEIWANVAEEFAMFDVDVTTERPTGEREIAFQSRGTHALILSEESIRKACACGGVAFESVFNSGETWSYPALVFSKYGEYFAPPSDTAELISHEVGHTLGLAHDGTATETYYRGHAMWSPLMGAGRGRGIATWSYGGYPRAVTRSTQSAGNDDYAQIGYFLDLHQDDFGNTLDTAKRLSDADLEGITHGIISTREDSDVFQFEVTEELEGLWEIEVLPAPYSPNLDPELKLFDGMGNVLTTENPLVQVPSNLYTNLIDGLDAHISIELSAGVYFISIDGVGQGSLSLGTGYDDYASRGTYSLRIGSPSYGTFIRRILPAYGGAGTAVRILGSNLNNVTGLRLGDQAITKFTKVSNNEIVFGVPNGVTSAPLIISTFDEEIVALQNFVIVNESVTPALSSISSMSGVIDQVILIEGDNIGAATAVTLAGLPINFSITGSKTLEFRVTPEMKSGQLRIVTPGGSVNARGTFSVKIPITLTSFSPSTTYEGATLTILGSNFTSDTEVTFYGGARGTRPKITSNQITLKVPSGALTGPITLSNSIGSVTSFEQLTIIIPAPLITKFSPTTAQIGSVVSITGSNFVNVRSVKLGNLNTSFTVVSSNTIRFTVPVGARKSKISVTTDSGTATSKIALGIR